MARLDAFLQLGCAQGCSDIHLAMGVPPMLRLHGDLLPVKYRDLDAEELTSLLREIVTDGQWATFMAGHDLDFSYAQEAVGRFRVNLFRKTQGIGATFRVIPSQVPTLDTLGLPPVVQQLTQVHQGLVLVQPSTWFPLHICGVKPTVSKESQFSQQVCGVEAKHTLHTCEPPR